MRSLKAYLQDVGPKGLIMLVLVAGIVPYAAFMVFSNMGLPIWASVLIAVFSTACAIISGIRVYTKL